MKTLVPPGVKAKIAPPPFLPYDYQEPIIKGMVQAIVEGKSGLVIQPTATGKSVEAAFTARACILLHGMKGLYLYSENEGLAQARKKFQEIFGANRVKCASYFGYGKDDFVHEADMVFASFQSLNSQYGKWYLNFVKNHFGFVIVNEAHHSQADTYKEVIEYFECGKIGMTATEKRMDGRDIRELFPHTICEIRIEEAIAKKWVANIEYHVLLSGLSTQKLKKIVQDVLEEGKRISIKQLNENIFVEMHNREVLKEIYKYAFPEDGPSRQVLLFCENINHVEEMLRLLLEDGMAAGAIHSKQFQSKNREVMKGVREGKIQFLVSVNKLNEDIDLPEVEVGALLRSTDSETVFAQQFGRLLRKSKKKEKAIYLDFVANVDRIIAIQNMIQSIEDFAIKAGDGLLQKDLMRVVGEGFDFSFSDELRDIMQILRGIREGFYSTWQEATNVVIALGIKSRKEYRISYRKDLRLSSVPEKTYLDFPGWGLFLGKGKVKRVGENFYPTWQEAAEAAKKLGISSNKQYALLYSQDPRLPSTLNIYYEDFPGWYKFLGKEKPNFYPTWQEAAEAASIIGVTTRFQYREFYKQDRRLTVYPDSYYEDFPGWDIFIKKRKHGFYPNWQEAGRAALKLGISSYRDYQSLYIKDPRLPSTPKHYEDYPGWEKFLDKEF